LINWWATESDNQYFLASESISQKVSVAKFWNSSTYKKNGVLSFFDIHCLHIAAWKIFVTKIAHKNHIISACSFHFGSFTKSIFCSFIIWAKSSLFSWLENIFFNISTDRSCHTLFSIGIMASVLNCWLHPANSLVQKFLTTSSLICSIISYLKSLSVRALIISNRVELGLSKSAKNIILSTCSSLAFQFAQKNL